MRASAFVGRVGGLAVALGIGAAAFGAAAPAWAAPDAAGSSDSDTAAQTDSVAAASRSRAGRSPGQRHDTRAASLAQKNSGPAVAESVSAPHPPIGSQSANRAVPRVAATVASESNFVEVQPVSPVADAAATVAAAKIGPVAATPPAAVSAPVSGTVGSVPTSLLGTNPGAPVGEPLSWVVLAVARRESGQSQAVVAPAAVTSTEEPAVPPAAVAGNSAPVISTVALSAPKASTGAVTGTVTATDPNGDKMTYKAVTSGAKGAVSITAAGVFTYTPTATARHSAAKAGATTAATTDTVTVTVTDSKGAATTKAVTVTISPKNAVPVTRKTVGTPNASTGVVTGSVTATDADKDTLTYSANATTAKGTVTVNAGTGAFTYTPNAAARHAAAKSTATAADKTDTFTVTVADGYGGTVAVPVTVTISPKNTAPVLGTTTVGTPNANTGVVTGTVSATDADRDALTYSGNATTTKGTVTVNAATGAFTYTPTAPARGAATTDSFTVTVTDGYGGTTPVTVSVPVAANIPGSTAKVTYVFNYTSNPQLWTPEAKAALQESADKVAAYIVVSQPITLTFDVTATDDPSSDTMASTGSDLTSSRSGFYNTVVQNKILTGMDSNGATADGYIDVNFGTGYAFDDTVGASQYDFESTMMHEMLHAYGFLSYVDEAGYNRYTQWTKFDSFIGTSAGAKVINLNGYKFKTAYNANLTGGNGGLYFLGANAVAAYGGPVPLYTPAPWEAGSSVSHLDDDVFTGAQTQLMNAMAGTGLGIRTLSTVELGILKDIGYTVNQNPAAASMLFVGLIFLRRRRNR
ncbi:MAG TPA: Ig-like domain-containing protein [Mycobacterium sp.]|nr:Ig-like domain-containing protein [Mycobacterium sp.]HQC76995.1 Ig-like domain-containing protein [Mycobacterium sp.]